MWAAGTVISANHEAKPPVWKAIFMTCRHDSWEVKLLCSSPSFARRQLNLKAHQTVQPLPGCLLTLPLMTVTVASATFMFTDGQASLSDEVMRLSMALLRVSMPMEGKDR